MSNQKSWGFSPSPNAAFRRLGNTPLNTPRNGAPADTAQPVPPVQALAHGTGPAPELTAHASNLAVTAGQPSAALHSTQAWTSPFSSAEMSDFAKKRFDLDAFLSDEPQPTQTPSKAAASGPGDLNASLNSADTDKTPPKKSRKLKMPKTSFSRKTTGDTESEGSQSHFTSKLKSKFEFKLNLGATKHSPSRPTTLEADVDAPPSSNRQGSNKWTPPLHLGDLNPVGPAHTRFQTPRGNRATQQQQQEEDVETFLGNLQKADQTQSIPTDAELFESEDRDTVGVTLQAEPVTAQELDASLAALRASLRDEQPMHSSRRFALPDLPQPASTRVQRPTAQQVSDEELERLIALLGKDIDAEQPREKKPQ